MFRSLGLLCAVLAAVSSQAQERSRRNPHTTPADVAAGARFYRPLCSNCHGHRGEGVVGLAPPIAGGLHHASNDGELYDLLLNGIPGTGMPAFTFDERQTWQVVAFVRSLARPDASARGNAAQGARIFREQICGNCHRSGGAAPDLAAAAAIRTAEELRRSIAEPSAEVHPRYYRIRAQRSDGSVVEGRRLNEDSYSIQALTRDGRLVSLDKTRLAEVDVLRESPMPSFEGRLTGSEIDDVVAYLLSLAAETQP